jgi:hypothetical protein
VISSSQRPLPDNTQHSQHTTIHAPGGIRTHDLTRLATANLHLRLRDHWYRHVFISILLLFVVLSLSFYWLSFFLLFTSVSRFSSFLIFFDYLFFPSFFPSLFSLYCLFFSFHHLPFSCISTSVTSLFSHSWIRK